MIPGPFIGRNNGASLDVPPHNVRQCIGASIGDHFRSDITGITGVFGLKRNGRWISGRPDLAMLGTIISAFGYYLPSGREVA